MAPIKIRRVNLPVVDVEATMEVLEKAFRNIFEQKEDIKKRPELYRFVFI